MVLALKDKVPNVSKNCYIAASADIIGDVSLGDKTSVWYQCVLRGDVMPIVIGSECNIQDQTTLHGTYQKFGVRIHDRVSIGHSCVLHGCEIEPEVLVGMGSVVMDGVKIGARSLIAAGSLITQNQEIPPMSLVMGSPAKVIRQVNEKELKIVTSTPDNYLIYQDWYKEI